MMHLKPPRLYLRNVIICTCAFSFCILLYIQMVPQYSQEASETFSTKGNLSNDQDSISSSSVSRSSISRKGMIFETKHSTGKHFEKPVNSNLVGHLDENEPERNVDAPQNIKAFFSEFNTYFNKIRAQHGVHRNRLSSLPETSSLRLRIKHYDDTGKWQKFDALGTLPVPVRSLAIMDLRLSVFDIPCIRIHLIHPLLYSKRRIGQSILHLWKGDEIIGTLNHPIIDGLSARPFFIKNMYYKESLLTFKLPSDMLDTIADPDAVSLGKSITSKELNNKLNLFYSENIENKLTEKNPTFAVCVKTLYREMTNDEIVPFVEWVEQNRMFGVDKIFIYNATLKITPEIKRMFGYYKSLGILDIKQFHTPFAYDGNSQTSEYDATALLMRAAINDCMYRYGQKFSYVLVIDTDEVLVPEFHDSYVELIRYINTLNPAYQNASAFTFPSSAYYQDFKADPTQPEVLTSVRYRTYVEPPNLNSSLHNYIYAKSIVNPMRCIYAYNHFCLVGDMEHINISPRIATIHHYRKSCSATNRKSKKGEPNRKCHFRQPQPQSDRMLHFKDTLLQRVTNTLTAINYTYYRTSQPVRKHLSFLKYRGKF